eukprot:11868325-Karenia_brevis.AAC.1
MQKSARTQNPKRVCTNKSEHRNHLRAGQTPKRRGAAKESLRHAGGQHSRQQARYVRDQKWKRSYHEVDAVQGTLDDPGGPQGNATA